MWRQYPLIFFSTNSCFSSIKAFFSPHLSALAITDLAFMVVKNLSKCRPTGNTEALGWFISDLIQNGLTWWTLQKVGSCVLEALKRLLWAVWLKIINQWTQTLDQRAETENTREPVSCVLLADTLTSCWFTCALSYWKIIWFMCIWIHLMLLFSFFKLVSHQC